MEPPNWAELLGALGAAIDATPTKRYVRPSHPSVLSYLVLAGVGVLSSIVSSDADYVPLVNKLDAVLDEVKSGEDVSPVLEKLVNLLRRLFAYPNWQLIQTGTMSVVLLQPSAELVLHVHSAGGT